MGDNLKKITSDFFIGKSIVKLTKLFSMLAFVPQKL